MDKPEQRFKVDMRVKLREGVDPGLYDGFSRVGNEGWIRKRRRDKYGYPQVLIEWDKDHWAYNGTKDGWTWEGQFEAVEENEMGDAAQPNNQEELEERVRGITENFVKSIFGAMGTPVEQAASDESEESTSEEVDGSDKWENLVAEVNESVTNAPAYLVIALERMEVQGAPPMVIPRVFHAAQKSEYALIVQSQLAHVLASLQDTTIAGVLKQQAADEDK